MVTEKRKRYIDIENRPKVIVNILRMLSAPRFFEFPFVADFHTRHTYVWCDSASHEKA